MPKKKLTLHPLKFEEALRALLKVKPEKKEGKPQYNHSETPNLDLTKQKDE